MTWKNSNGILFLFLCAALALWNAPPLKAATLPIPQEEIEEESEEETQQDENEDEGDHDDGDHQDEDRDEEGEDGDEEEEDEKERITLEYVIEFTEEHLPEAAEHIQELLEEEGEDEEIVQHIVEQGRDMIHGYFEIKETHGRRLGEKFLQLFRVNMQIEQMQDEAHEMGAQERAKLKKHIKNLLSERYSLELALEKAELNLLKAEVQDFEEEINRRVENRDDIIAEQLQEFLEDVNEEGSEEDWDDEGENEDEEEELEGDNEDEEGDDEEDEEDDMNEPGDDVAENAVSKKKVA